MKTLILGKEKTTKKQLPTISPKLLQLVLKEINNRLMGKKKWCANETLEQIVWNKYTVMELEKE